MTYNDVLHSDSVFRSLFLAFVEQGPDGGAVSIVTAGLSNTNKAGIIPLLNPAAVLGSYTIRPFSAYLVLSSLFTRFPPVSSTRRQVSLHTNK